MEKRVEITEPDKPRLLALAKAVAELAEDPDNENKRNLWKQHNGLKGEKPVIFVHPDGAWNELLPHAELECEGEWARRIEYILKQRIIRYKVIQDDVPIPNTLGINRSVISINRGWGLIPEKVFSKAEGRGAWKFEPVVRHASDWKKLRKPALEMNEDVTRKRFEETKDLLGELLDVSLRGVTSFDFHIMHLYCDLRGLEQMMMDLVTEPNMVHDVVSFMTKGFQGLIRQCVENNLVSLNNNDTFHYTGGIGYTDELPKAGFDGEKARLCDVWASAEAQEFAQVSPEMHEEFILQYERKLIEPFGLNGYGCCGDLTRKLDSVLKIPNLRRVSICPWADIGACADILKKNYIMSWKPQPAYLASQYFDSVFLEKYIEDELKKGRHGYLELVLRDTHTCRNEPQRFGEFVRIARKVIERVFS